MYPCHDAATLSRQKALVLHAVIPNTLDLIIAYYSMVQHACSTNMIHPSKIFMQFVSCNMKNNRATMVIASQ